MQNTTRPNGFYQQIPLPNAEVKIVEMGPRDGLQNESISLPLQIKVEFIEKLLESGLKNIEAGSFVSPKWIPQMADTAEVLLALKTYQKDTSLHFPVLVPNLKGLENALDAGVKEIAIFAAASETFSQKNINCSIEESLSRFKEVMDKIKQVTKEKGTPPILIRGYVSCALGCPYEGHIEPLSVVKVSKALFDLGCYEISIGDTIGVGTPNSARAVFKMLSQEIPVNALAMHFHDTYGQAIANIYACLELGVRTIDSSTGGLGGCPYAKGASGNVATEDVLYLLHGLGMETGVDLEKIVQTAYFICDKVKHPPRSKVALALKEKVGI